MQDKPHFWSGADRHRTTNMHFKTKQHDNTNRAYDVLLTTRISLTVLKFCVAGNELDSFPVDVDERL